MKDETCGGASKIESSEADPASGPTVPALVADAVRREMKVVACWMR